jgi:hypothetical protein
MCVGTSDKSDVKTGSSVLKSMHTAVESDYYILCYARRMLCNAMDRDSEIENGKKVSNSGGDHLTRSLALSLSWQIQTRNCRVNRY